MTKPRAVRKSATHVLYVSPAGRDAWSGLLPEPNAAGTDGPFRTIPAAQKAVRKLTAKGLKRPVRVLLRGGDYFLDRTLTFSPRDSGSAKCPVTYAAYPGEAPLLSGGRRITGWRAEKINGRDGWVADLPEVAAGNVELHPALRERRAALPAAPAQNGLL